MDRLRKAVTIRTLTILEGNDFGALNLCLHDGTICPLMEKLVYHNYEVMRDER